MSPTSRIYPLSKALVDDIKRRLADSSKTTNPEYRKALQEALAALETLKRYH